MIIVEGPDGSGKSTLIKALNYQATRLKALRGGVGGTKSNGTGDGIVGWGGLEQAVGAYTDKVMEMNEQPGKHAFDRFHLSEAVYGPLLRQKQELPPTSLLDLSRFLRHHHVPVVLCLPPFEVTLANVTREGREKPPYQTEGFLHMAYKAFEFLQPWATIVFDYTKDPLPNL